MNGKLRHVPDVNETAGEKEVPEMKNRKNRMLPALLAAVLMLSSCAPAVRPSASQPASESETAAVTPASSSEAEKSTEENVPETQPAESVPETQPTEKPSVPETAPTETEPETRPTKENQSGRTPKGYSVQFRTPYGEAPEAQQVPKGGLVTEPAEIPVPGKTFAGWYREGIGGRWNFDEDRVTEPVTLMAVYTDPVPRAAGRLNLHDIGRTAAELQGTHAAVVIFIGYTDGIVPEKDRYEAFFAGDYGQEKAMDSLSTYFRLNSYGKVSMEFYFHYYDTGMSCREAYDYTEDAGKAMELLYDGFREFQQAYDGDLRDWDRNGDGYVDMLYFISCEDPAKTIGNGKNRYIYGAGATPTENIPPDPERPVIHTYSKLAYFDMLKEILPGTSLGGLRILIHETGHIFGLEDYYNSKTKEGENDFETLGMYDMQAFDMGDWNVFSRFAAGWLDPYVIDGTMDEVTLRLGCSSEVPDAVLIPTAAGWNGTAFDEYILIDVMAPYAANALDWERLCQLPLVQPDDPRIAGGVRVYHADGRLVRAEIGATAVYTPVNTYEEILAVTQEQHVWLWRRFLNSDGYEPKLPEDSFGKHQIEIVPSDGSGRFRGKDQIMFWQAVDSLLVNDLFGPGDVFSMEKCAGAFVDAPLMNNGSSLDYEMTVDFYDPEAREAVITIRKIR